MFARKQGMRLTRKCAVMAAIAARTEGAIQIVAPINFVDFG
jgi:hypothetical protein